MRNDFPISYISFSFTAQSTGVGCDHTIEEPVHALAGDHQEENRGTDRARVSGTDARGQKGLCVFSLKFQAQKKKQNGGLQLATFTGTRCQTHVHVHTPHTLMQRSLIHLRHKNATSQNSGSQAVRFSYPLNTHHYLGSASM